MEEGRCVQSCSVSYYLDHSSEGGYKSCKRCDNSCLTCIGPGFKNCSSCPSGYLLDLGMCQMGAICKDATEESWAEGGFCMLVKKNNLCQRKVLQQLCCKTCTFQGWAATLHPCSCRLIDYSILLKKKSQKLQTTSLFLAIFFFSLSISSLCREMVNCFDRT